MRKLRFAPGGREQCGPHVVSSGAMRQQRNEADLRSLETDRWDRWRVCGSREAEDAVEEADEIFPNEVVGDQHEGSENREGVRGEAGNRKVEKSRGHHAERREQNGEQSAVEAER